MSRIDDSANHMRRLQRDQIADAYAKGYRQATSDAAATAHAWSEPQVLRLHAGEMTGQEMRTARAIMAGIVARIRALTPAPEAKEKA